VLLPVELSPSYLPAAGWRDLWGYAGLLLLLSIGAALARRRELPRGPVPLLAGAFLIAVFPTSGVVPVSQLRADRFLYLALGFAAALIGIAADRVRLRASSRWGRGAVWGALVAFVALLMAQTHDYAGVWRSDVTLWKHVLHQEPDHPLATGELGAIALEQAHLDLAERLLRRSAAQAPHLEQTWTNLCRVQGIRAETARTDDERREHLEEARRQCRRAVAADPEHAPAHAELGRVSWLLGDPSSAEQHLRQALHLSRPPPDTLPLLRRLLAEQGRVDAAQAVLKRYCAEHRSHRSCRNLSDSAPGEGRR
jgi:tetratricopeptide (TPR) repeat protein